MNIASTWESMIYRDGRSFSLGTRRQDLETNLGSLIEDQQKKKKKNFLQTRKRRKRVSAQQARRRHSGLFPILQHFKARSPVNFTPLRGATNVFVFGKK